MTLPVAGRPGLPKALRLRDLILLKVAAILNISLVPLVAGFGLASLALWVLAFLAFLVPEMVAVVALARRYPGEGGVYLWARRQFGEAHGFLSGWCYWTNNLFYVPMQLVYIAGVAAYASEAPADLLAEKWFVSLVAFGCLGVMTIANIRGLGVGKWVQNAGAVGAALTAGLVVLAGGRALSAGAGPPPAIAGSGWEMLSGFSVMCFAFVGIELASTMGDEIEAPERNLPRAVVAAGVITLVGYVAVTASLVVLVPPEDIGAVQGVMQAIVAGAERTGTTWLVAPLAILLAIAIAGGASAWFAGSARVPFVAGLDRALPASLGRVHHRWRSPHVALLVSAIVSAGFVGLALAGSTVAEAYQVLLRAAVVIQLVPFLYLFAGLMRLEAAPPWARVAGLVGLATSAFGIVTAFIPPSEGTSVLVFELKMLAGVVVPVGVGWMLFRRAGRQAGAASTSAATR
ncbi:MAG: APC family permease [Vicinamibacterales bacterium]